MPPLFFQLFQRIATFFFVSCCWSAAASPWIDSDNHRLRAHISFLSDRGVFDLGVTTWPLMWRDVQREIEKVELSSLTSPEFQVLSELRFELRRQRVESLKHQTKLSFGTGDALDRSSLRGHQGAAIQKQFDVDGENVSTRLQAQVLYDGEESDFETVLDGSHLLYGFDNWVVGVGAINRWWGPSDQESLILSDFARPTPGVMLSTLGEQQFVSGWLNWIGPWQFVSFVSQLESSRVVPDAMLTGMRFSFRPLESLELGASRAMMWGGEGRDDSVKAFWKSLTSQDENTEKQSGNQLGGFDARYSFLLTGHQSLSLYTQLIGEDEAGYMPSKYLSQFGASLSQSLPSGYVRFYAEYLDTAAGSLNEPQYGAAYQHSVYKTGYRYRGRAIAASIDGDSTSKKLGLVWQGVDQRSFSASVSSVEFNQGNASSGHTLSPDKFDFLRADFAYRFLLWGGALEMEASFSDKELSAPPSEISKSDVGLSWLYRF